MHSGGVHMSHSVRDEGRAVLPAAIGISVTGAFAILGAQAFGGFDSWSFTRGFIILAFIEIVSIVIHTARARRHGDTTKHALRAQFRRLFIVAFIAATVLLMASVFVPGDIALYLCGIAGASVAALLIVLTLAIATAPGWNLAREAE